ncbi:GntR family transcriptional regulator [Mycolicibacillus parakoreensis]|uniref:GntR family transcriptional regulator n=1 Tax=Mycolicibacillus parakoreensis TaxID=1069221 RepID=A0ABY3U236_9MYCO|nr:GntR family transcriptional regulator [Mycolicibacillus parakoreensis]MCV7314436.1 GntR family transcriptional regulator [Mycolicibacillus parakoreensis]ULN53224.1 GntR family transcriptional regulator [Mycolicibacillus parakoreensis]
MTDVPANAAERAHVAIRTAILNGDYAAGTMLSESALAASLSMSRTPVRAALGRLQDEGFVTIYPKRGALVRELTAAEVREFAQVRHALESAGVRLADPEARAGLSMRLAENLARQEDALHGKDFLQFAALAMEFHRAFVELSDNETMLLFYDRIRDRQYRTILGNPTLSRDPRLMLDEHRALLNAAVSGDWHAFSEILGNHQSHSYHLE